MTGTAEVPIGTVSRKDSKAPCKSRFRSVSFLNRYVSIDHMSIQHPGAVQGGAVPVPNVDAARQLSLRGLLPIADLIAVAEQLARDGQPQASAQLYRDWIAHHDSPVLYVAHFNLGVLLANLQEHESAEQSYRAALALMPDFPQAHLNLGSVLERLGRPEEALEAWRAVLARDKSGTAEDLPLLIHALNNLGRLLEIRGDNATAAEMLTRSLMLDPNQPQAIAHWVHLRQKLCIWPAFAPILGITHENLIEAASALAQLAESDDSAVHLAAAQRYVDKKVLPLQTPLAPADGYDHPTLRIGYLSSDYCNHPVSILTAELYALHDRSKVKVYGFSWSPDDGSTLRARVVGAMDHYIRIDAMSDEEAARCIRAHEIDILVDLHGLTLGTRHDILSWRPAPVQVTWLGFPGPTALPSIDYVIADRFVLPEELQPHFTEKALYLPECFQINDRKRPIGPPPTRAACGLPENAFVFCSFNSNFKIKPEVFAAWMEILRRTEGSVLWLIADGEAVRANLRDQARVHGIDPERLLFAGRVAPENYLARYQVADLFLDTLPFNAGTTASDALWAGLPLLTCTGKTFAARMAGSLLHAVDLPQLVTYNMADYVELAVTLAGDRPRVEAMKRHLQDRRLTFALFDSPRTVRALEQKFFEIAKRPVHAAVSGAPAPQASITSIAAADGKKVKLFQIVCSDAALEQTEAGYDVLDHRDGERPDWRAYWPLRKFLLSQQLDDDTYYGFFSPDFGPRTGLSHAAVLDFIGATPAAIDVFTFSPQPDMGSFFLNVFEQADLSDPGFSAATDAFMAAAGRPLAVATLVMDSRQIVFDNFLVARPAFWRAWLELCEQLFAICEGADTPAKVALTQDTGNPGTPQRKVRLIERIASLLLTIEPHWRVRAYNTFRCSWSATSLAEHKLDAVLSDALKIAMREQGFDDYAAAFSQIRARLG
jgi:predicted O-linked N-acetylglucosamine transferase (SPINDLY family)